MNTKLMEELENPTTFDNIMDEDSRMINELTLLASSIKKEVCVVLHSFLSFLKKYEKRKSHNMLSLTLDPNFKNLRLISSLFGREQRVSIVHEYDYQL
jgi:hypothetical protein